MPKIFLKPNSPEFADQKAKNKVRHCEMPGCRDNAPHKAPKNRGLNEYYYFCLDHVKDYNKAWNFFSGMSDSEVEDHMVRAMYGDRPTWRYDNMSEGAEEQLKRKAWQAYSFSDKDEPRHKNGENGSTSGNNGFSRNTPEGEAMLVMGLEPPTNFKKIRARYKELAKKHHPDLNKGCSQSEELLKQINMAYTILKLAYESYEKLPDRH